MIDLYTYHTFNGQAAAIALKASGLNYKIHIVNLTKGEQNNEQFKSINPSQRIPVIVDHTTKPAIHISQSCAILQYIAEKSGKFLSKNIIQKTKTLQWLYFVASDIGTNVFNNFYLKALITPKETAAGSALKRRGVSFCDEIEQQLNEHEFLDGADLSIADFMCLPIMVALGNSINQNQHPSIKRWMRQMEGLEYVKEVLELNTSR